ncbi:MAG: hypothetical protein H6Q05_1841 [Acidobacteria bacterium]|nr:hypothetical protein [Acidobacteriota bacterium]
MTTKKTTVFLAAALALQVGVGLPQAKKDKAGAKKAAPTVSELVLAGKIPEAVKLAAKQPGAAETTLNTLMSSSDTQITLRQIPEARASLEAARKFLDACEKAGQAKNLPADALKGRELRLQGISLSDEKQFEKAEAFLHQALDISKKAKDPALEAGIHNNLGYALRNMNLLEEAAQEFESARQMAEEQKDDLRAGSYNFNLGEVLQKMGRRELALAAYKRSAEQNKAASRPNIEARAILMQGVVTSSLEPRGQDAVVLFLEAASKFEKVGDNQNAGWSYMLLGDHFGYAMDFKRVVEYCEKAVPLLSKAEDKAGLLRCYNTLTDMHGRLGDIPKCEMYKKLGEELSKKK